MTHADLIHIVSKLYSNYYAMRQGETPHFSMGESYPLDIFPSILTQTRICDAAPPLS